MEVNVAAAIKMYVQHKNAMQKYQRRHPEKCRESTQKYIEKMKLEDPQRYELIKLKNRERYHNKTKARKEQEQLDKLNLENV